MAQDFSQLIRRTINAEVVNLRGLTDERAGIPRAAGKWCPKEELGHLLDSAANNHQRFVRGALASEYHGPGYAQDEWVRIHGYREMSWEMLVGFWYEYNLLIAEVVERIPESHLTTPCFIGEGAPVALGFVIEDYVLHMQHHIDLLLRRPKITSYPGAAAAI
jgi:hypothetical protein